MLITGGEIVRFLYQYQVILAAFILFYNSKEWDTEIIGEHPLYELWVKLRLGLA